MKNLKISYQLWVLKFVEQNKKEKGLQGGGP